METVIQVQHLKKHFGDLQVLNDIAFEINKGEVVTIIGSSIVLKWEWFFKALIYLRIRPF